MKSIRLLTTLVLSLFWAPNLYSMLQSLEEYTPTYSVYIPLHMFFTIQKAKIIEQETNAYKLAIEETPEESSWWTTVYSSASNACKTVCNRAIDLGAVWMAYEEDDVVKKLSELLDEDYSKISSIKIYRPGSNLPLPKIMLAFFSATTEEQGQQIYQNACEKIDSSDIILPMRQAMKIALKYTCTEDIYKVIEENNETFKLIQEVKKEALITCIIPGNYAYNMWQSCTEDKCTLKKNIEKICDGEKNIFLSGAKNGALYPSEQLWSNLKLKKQKNSVLYDSKKENLDQCFDFAKKTQTPEELKKVLGILNSKSGKY